MMTNSTPWLSISNTHLTLGSKHPSVERAQTTWSAHQSLCCTEGHLLGRAPLVHLSSLRYKAILSVWSWLQEAVTGNGDALCHCEYRLRLFIWTDFPFFSLSLWESPSLRFLSVFQRWCVSAGGKLLQCHVARWSYREGSALASHTLATKPPSSPNKIPEGGSN